MIRAKISASYAVDGELAIKVEWIDVDEASNMGQVHATEQFTISGPKAKAGCAYVSRAAFDEGQFLPGTFWLDENGMRHFYMQADPGTFNLMGQPVGPGQVIVEG
jgi:hypothetical protein